MDTTEKELTLEESIKQVMTVLPPMIRTYLEEGKYTPVAKRLMGKYALRIDQGGVLEREIMLLIMGIEEPEEFIASLVSDANIPQDTAGKIIADVNQEVFIPLREEMRNAVGTPKAPVQQVAPTPIQKPIAQPAPIVPSVRPSAPASSIINLIPDGPKSVPSSSLPMVRPVSAPAVATLPPKTILPGTPQALKPRPPQQVTGVNMIHHAPLVAPVPPNPPVAKTPIPQAPKAYTSDPYREPVE